MDKVKMKTQQGAQEKVEMERKIGHSRKWAKQRRKGGEMLDGFIWTSVDLIIFLQLREKQLWKRLCVYLGFW